MQVFVPALVVEERIHLYINVAVFKELKYVVKSRVDIVLPLGTKKEDNINKVLIQAKSYKTSHQSHKEFLICVNIWSRFFSRAKV